MSTQGSPPATASTALAAGAPPVLGWSVAAARPGETVTLLAPAAGRPPGTPATFRIFPTSGDPAEPLATLHSVVAPDGVARALWRVEVSSEQLLEPSLAFEVEIGEEVEIAPALALHGQLELVLREPSGEPAAGAEVEIVDAYGERHPALADASGLVRLEVPLAPCAVVRAGYLLEGERRPASRTFLPSVGRHEVLCVPPPCVVEILEPADGEVLVAGSAVAVRAAVRPNPAAGQPATALPAAPERWTVNGPARLEEREGERWLVLTGEAGEIALGAEALGAGATVILRAVRPRLVRLQLVDREGNLVPLFDHTSGRPALPEFAFDARGLPIRAHPGAVLMATRLAARAWLAFAERPSRATRVELALVSERMRDRGLPPPADRRLREAPLVLRSPAGPEQGAVEIGAEAECGPIELVSDRELPACVRAYKLAFEVRCNVQHHTGRWSAPPEAPRDWPLLGRVYGVELFALWARPRVASGRPLGPGEPAVKKTDLDPFHVRHVVSWAEGGFHLRAEGEGSIPRLLLERLGHYEVPDGLEGKDGLPAAAHPTPRNLADLPPRGIGPAPVAAPRPVRLLPAGTTPPPGTGRRAVRLLLQRRAPATALRLPVVCGRSMALVLALEPEHRWGPVRLAVCIDGVQAARTRPLASGERSPALALDGLAPGPHLLELRFERPDGTEPEAVHAVLELRMAVPSWDARRAPAWSWGFEVLDHPEYPGGASHQAASVLATALALLGAPAHTALVRARPGGAVVLGAHDPVTRWTPCFEPIRHWGPNLHGFALLMPETARDTDPVLAAAAPLSESHPLVLDLGTRRALPAAEAVRTGHARRPPVRHKLLRPHCRCGHPWDPDTYPDWPARLRAGAPAQLRLAPEAPERALATWSELLPGASYTLWYQAPDIWYARGPVRAAGGSPEGEPCVRAVRSGAASPQRFALQLFDRLLLFDGTGAVRDPAAPELGTIGRLEAVGLPVFESGRRLQYRSYTVELAAPFERRWHHERTFRLAPIARAVRTEGRLRVALALAQPYAHYAVYARVLLGERLAAQAVLRPGESTGWLDLGTQPAGAHLIRVLMLASGHGHMRAGLHGTLTVELEAARPAPRRCVVCGAQPVWSYEIAGRLEDALVGAVVYPCTRCGATVHEEDGECWACGLALEPAAPWPAALAPPGEPAGAGRRPAP